MRGRWNDGVAIKLYLIIMSLPEGSDSLGLTLLQGAETAKLGSVHPSVQPTLASWTPFGCTVGTGCTVRAYLDSKMAFGAPTWPLYSQYELQLALPLAFQSAPDLQKVW